MHSMKRAVRESRYRRCEVGRPLQEGQKVKNNRRKRVIAQPLTTSPASPRRPDFVARLRSIYGAEPLKVSGAKLLAEERDRY